jgi:prolyl oligopeptidase
MRSWNLPIGLLVAVLAAGPALAREGLVYPTSRRGDTVDVYHGARVPDPYRWLEDDASPETRAWIEAQNAVTFAHLEKIPGRARFRERLTELWSFERYGLPWTEAGRSFYLHNSGLQNQDVLHVLDRPGGAPRVLLDPNTLSPDGTVALVDHEISRDGKLVAYALSSAGSDWREWRVRDATTGKDLPDVVRWSKFANAAWTRDGKGFFYGAYEEPAPGTERTAANYHQKLYYHRLGTPQTRDELVLERKDHKEWSFDPTVTDDGRYLVVTVSRSTDPVNLLWVKDLATKGSRWIEVVSRFEAQTTLVGNVGSRFYLATDKDAPRGRVVSVDLARRELAWEEVVPQERDAISGATLVNDSLIVRYLEDAQSRVSIFALGGKRLRDVALPGIGTAYGFKGRRTDKETTYLFTSFLTPPTIFRLDLMTGKSTVFRAPRVPFDPSRYETRRVFVTSKDGTRLPLFLTHRKGLAHDGDNPTQLYGYGGFDSLMTPRFSVANLAWVEAGGVYAFAVLRGDGVYGREFHEAGRLDRKQNVFDDFIAAAEHLVREKVTSPRRLAISGGSNGGLLVGAVVNQRPDLFGAALPAVGVMDMLRYHKFTIGWAWVGEYGSSDDPAQFRTLLGYSPLHNLKPGTRYPATLITTADHDDRVVPAHSFKYAAALQAAQAGPAPVLIRIETRAGHGAGKPTAKLIEEAADRLAFMSQALGMTTR